LLPEHLNVISINMPDRNKKYLAAKQTFFRKNFVVFMFSNNVEAEYVGDIVKLKYVLWNIEMVKLMFMGPCIILIVE